MFSAKVRALLCLVAGSLLLSSCIVGRFVVWNFADIRDYKKFPSRPVLRNAGVQAFRFQQATRPRAPRSVTVDGEELQFSEYLRRNNTVAFLIIRHDSIQYEQYFGGYDDSSIVPSFSMAKSVTSMLVGCAIADGYIHSVEDPVSDYLTDFAPRPEFRNLRIRHLLQMTSGIRFNESYYNPFAGAANYYYGNNLRSKVGRMRLKEAPGQHFEYISGGTQMLGEVLERAINKPFNVPDTGKGLHIVCGYRLGRTISDYLQEKIWQPLGMEWDASWSIDQKKGGMEKTFCCLNARARDFARLGRLYLRNGNWDGRQIVPADWVAISTKSDTTEGSVPYYKYQWWLPSNQGDYMAQGHLGQYIYVNPAKDIIIVRLGKNEGKVPWWDILKSLSASY